MTSSSSRLIAAGLDCVRAGVTWHAPDLVHGVLSRLGDTKPAIHAAQHAHGQGQQVAVQRVDVAGQLVADDRKLGHRRTQNLLLQVCVAVQGVTQHGDQQQQQRKHRQESIEGDQRRQIIALILDVLVDHGQRQPSPSVATLKPVECVRFTHADSPADADHWGTATSAPP